MGTSRAWKNARSANKWRTAVSIAWHGSIYVTRCASAKIVKAIATSAKLLTKLLVYINIRCNSSVL
jgi:hypothetical protein